MVKADLFCVLQPTQDQHLTGNRIYEHIETYPAREYAQNYIDDKGGESSQQGATVFYEIHENLGKYK